LRDATRESVPGILNGLVAPTREAAGQEAAEAIRKAERTSSDLASPRSLTDIV
jgi:hypothetical protein